MEDKVLCPYCGSEMKRWTEYELPNQTYFTVRYICGECGATSPQQVHTDRERANELAKEEALKRFKPLQKPMTLEEASGTNEFVWIETITNKFVCPCDLCYAPEGGRRLTAYMIGDIFQLYYESQYNKTWRCWATKPTEEERQAAEWDTTQK